MSLPLTFFDELKKNQPNLVKLAEENAAERDRLIYDYAHNNGPIKAFIACFEYIHSNMMAKLMRGQIEDERFLKPENYEDRFEELSLMIHSCIYRYWISINFIIGGKNTYYFSNNLTEHLSVTDAKIDCEFLKLPFKSAMMVFTSPLLIDTLYTAAFKNLEISDSFYATPLSVFVNEFPTNESGKRNLSICIEHESDEDEVGIFFFYNITLTDGKLLSQAIASKSELEELFPTIYPIASDSELDKLLWENLNQDSELIKSIEPFLRIILNGILYLSSASPDLISFVNQRKQLERQAKRTHSGSKKRKLLKQAEKTSSLNYHEVGNSFMPIIIDHYEEEEKDDNQITNKRKYRLKNKFKRKVGGHWKNQAFGKKWQDHRLIWVPPFYKGKDFAEMMNRPYVVK